MIMNLILKMAKCVIEYNDIPKWKLIARKKKSNELELLMHEFYQSDPFEASDAMLETLECINYLPNQLGKLFHEKNYISIIDIVGDGSNVEYFAKSKRFYIITRDISFEVYRNSKLNKISKEKWLMVTKTMLLIYTLLLIDIIEAMHKGDGEKCKTLLTNLSNRL